MASSRRKGRVNSGVLRDITNGLLNLIVDLGPVRIVGRGLSVEIPSIAETLCSRFRRKTGVKWRFAISL